MSEKHPGWWDPASIGAIVGAIATAVLGVAVRLRTLFAKSDPPVQQERFPTPSDGHLSHDGDALLRVINLLGNELKTRDEKIALLEATVKKLSARLDSVERELSRCQMEHHQPETGE